jgi:tellurite resistance protein
MENRAQEQSIKLEHFSNLVAVAHSDGFLDNEEKDFLAERAEEYGLSQEEVQEVMNKAEELKFIVPLNFEEKEDQLADIVYMAMIDGVVHEKEYELCLSIAQKLDFEQADLDHVIELTRKLWLGLD